MQIVHLVHPFALKEWSNFFSLTHYIYRTVHTCMWMRTLLLSNLRSNELNVKAMWLWQEDPSVYQLSVTEVSCVWVMRMDGDEQAFSRGQIAFWQGNAGLCQSGVCSSHCPLAHITHVQYTHMLTLSLKPISFTQGMGTPLISLLPPSSLPPHHPCPLAHPLSSCPLSIPLSYLFPSHPHPVLPSLCHSLWYPLLPSWSSCPPLALFPLSVFSLLVSFFFLCIYFLPPSVPNLPWARSVFFPDNLFLIPQN